MKPAKITRRRTLRDGRRLVLVVCPLCRTSHWYPATADRVACPRRPGQFRITPEGTKP